MLRKQWEESVYKRAAVRALVRLVEKEDGALGAVEDPSDLLRHVVATFGEWRILVELDHLRMPQHAHLGSR